MPCCPRSESGAFSCQDYKDEFGAVAASPFFTLAVTKLSNFFRFTTLDSMRLFFSSVTHVPLLLPTSTERGLLASRFCCVSGGFGYLQLLQFHPIIDDRSSGEGVNLPKAWMSALKFPNAGFIRNAVVSCYDFQENKTFHPSCVLCVLCYAF